MKKLISVLGIITVLVFYFAYYFYNGYSGTFNLIAVSWGDGKYGKAFYGVYVYAVPFEDKISVKSTIHIGRGTPFVGYQYDLGEIGISNSMEEAVKQWGKITWSDEGVLIGKGQNHELFITKEKIESHR
ncbi:MAG: hypothetical protein COB67_09400 [SAR324 cluster bacterium]|uniref:Uncharacterized protein n=1 Tax=SAR324 cluster bacterium TaxID=2024889 RepID=A0A2A4T111_9DELT|nr:MAG: hypothetical protein COB67_09400 [SAR324 cluster bacterium]